MTIYEMDSEEDPFAVLEQMLANKGKRRAPGKHLTPKKKPVVKREVLKIDDDDGAESEEPEPQGSSYEAEVQPLVSGEEDMGEGDVGDDVPKKKFRTEISFGPISVSDTASARAIVDGSGSPAAAGKKIPSGSASLGKEKEAPAAAASVVKPSAELVSRTRAGAVVNKPVVKKKK
jgi:hypothetical protein